MLCLYINLALNVWINQRVYWIRPLIILVRYDVALCYSGLPKWRLILANSEINYVFGWKVLPVGIEWFVLQVYHVFFKHVFIMWFTLLVGGLYICPPCPKLPYPAHIYRILSIGRRVITTDYFQVKKAKQNCFFCITLSKTKEAVLLCFNYSFKIPLYKKLIKCSLQYSS